MQQLRLSLAAGLALWSQAALAAPQTPARTALDLPEESDGPLSVSLEAGVGFDDSIFNEDTDTGGASGDELLETELNVDLRVLGKEKGPSLELGYGYERSDYKDVKAFALQSHRLSTTGRAKLGDANLSLGYSYNIIRLAGDPLLSLHVVAPSVSQKLSKRLIGLVSYSFVRKDFSTLNERDSDSHNLTVTTIRLLDLKGSYAYAALGAGKESAFEPEFSNRSWSFDLSVVKKEAFQLQRLELSASASYSKSRYPNFNTFLQGFRRDRDMDFEVQAKYALDNRLSAFARFERNDSRSNLSFASYAANRVQAGLMWEL